MAGEPTFDEMLDTMKRAAAALQRAEIPFMLGGGLAVWAYGGPETEHDVDFMLLEADAPRAQEALVEAGMKPEDPPENWLLKAYDGEVLVDLIFCSSAGPITVEMIERAEERSVQSMRLKVSSLEDVLVQKLLVINEQQPDYTSVLELSRSVREQIDWEDVRERTKHSAFAAAFFTLIEQLDVLPA
ncbi:MAG TPA: nucleotidyltransferase [Gaiellaceae bacterium]|jgi:predicted nucleotidyltransferase